MKSTLNKEPVIVVENKQTDDIKVLQKMNEEHFDSYGIYSQTLLRSLGKMIEGRNKQQAS